MRLDDQAVVNCAGHAMNWAAIHLEISYGVDGRVAEEVATRAGNAFATELIQALSENGITVVRSAKFA